LLPASSGCATPVSLRHSFEHPLHGGGGGGTGDGTGGGFGTGGGGDGAGGCGCSEYVFSPYVRTARGQLSRTSSLAPGRRVAASQSVASVPSRQRALRSPVSSMVT
jgi:hypothetical protein